jgi:hypothetical protein
MVRVYDRAEDDAELSLCHSRRKSAFGAPICFHAVEALIGLAGLLGTVAPIERFTEHRFDDGLTTDIQHLCLSIQFLQHRGGEVYVDALNCGPDNGEPVREVTRDVLPAICHLRDLLRTVVGQVLLLKEHLDFFKADAPIRVRPESFAGIHRD